MPLFAKEPIRLCYGSDGPHDGGSGRPSSSNNNTAASSSRLIFEDADEADWMYIACSRQLQGMKDKIQRKLRMFSSMTSYERRHARIRIRNGNEMTLQLFRSDSIHDEESVAYYDLSTLQNVKNISIAVEDALPYLSFRDETEGGTGASDQLGGVAVTELVYGDIGLRLEFEESVSDGANGSGGGHKHADASTSAQELRSMMLSPFDRVATAVAQEMSGDGDGGGGGGDAHASHANTTEGKSSKKLQKKLERKGKASSLHFVFPTVDVREEWGHWFRVLMRHLELQRITDYEIDPVTSRPIDVVDQGFIQRLTDVRTSTISSVHFRKAVKDMTTKFLKVDVQAAGSLEPPNKGRLKARVPGYDRIGHYELSAWVQSGEVVLTPYRPKESIAKSLLNFHHAFRGAGALGAAAVATSSGGGGMESGDHVRRIRLTDQTLIRASSPWSCEFQIILCPTGASTVALQDPSFAGAAALPSWHFIAPNSEVRRSFVEWLRLVKGRGTKSQTDLETYPYQFQGKTDGSPGGADDGVDMGPGGEFGDDYMFLDSYEGARRRRLLQELHHSPAVDKAAAAAAAFVARQRNQSVVDGTTRDSEEDAVDDATSETDTSVKQRRRSNSRAQEDARLAAVAEDDAAERALTQKRHMDAASDAEYQLFRELQEPFPSPRSDDTVHSVRRFAYFPGHRESIVASYLDDVCAVHIAGRGERAGASKADARKRHNRHWAYAEAARLTSASPPHVDRALLTAHRGGTGPPPRGDTETSVLVQQLLVSRRRDQTKIPSSKRMPSPAAPHQPVHPMSSVAAVPKTQPEGQLSSAKHTPSKGRLQGGGSNHDANLSAATCVQSSRTLIGTAPKATSARSSLCQSLKPGIFSKNLIARSSTPFTNFASPK